MRGRPVRARSWAGHDHARMESFWATMKIERIDGQVYASHAEAKSAPLRDSEVFSNRPRPHGAPGFQSPVDFEHRLN